MSTDFLRAATGVDLPDNLLSFPTHSLQDAPALPGARRPVLLFSHGFGIPAALNTSLLHEELASWGYVVAGIDHTFDAAVEFPDGRVEVQRPGLTIDDLLREVRAADLRFVLDQFTALAAGLDSDAGHRPLPRGLARMLDLTRVGAYGHSLGGPTVIGAMNQDRRIDAGAALDGTLRGPVIFDRPFLMMGNQHERRADDPDWAVFFDQLLGPRLHLVIDGARHSDLTDITVFKSTIDEARSSPPARLTAHEQSASNAATFSPGSTGLCAGEHARSCATSPHVSRRWISNPEPPLRNETGMRAILSATLAASE